MSISVNKRYFGMPQTVRWWCCCCCCCCWWWWSW